MPTYTLPFEKLSKRDIKIAGGKGAQLAEMTKAGMRVPPGFVVLIDAVEKFFELTDIDVEIEARLDNVDLKDLTTVDRASHELRSIIAKAKFPKEISQPILKSFSALKSPWVAVRSSATAEDSKMASWAGELETYLFINRKNLIETVKKCWSSLFTQRAIFYRFEKKLHKTKVMVAVVVQKMVNSEKSGIAFTVHPVTKDKHQMVIEAGWGLGEAIVSGKITPDTYVIDKRDEYIIDININTQDMMIVRATGGGTHESAVANARRHKQILSGKEIIELVRLCKKIESYYHHPQDIEWAQEKGTFYITQTRPITTL